MSKTSINVETYRSERVNTIGKFDITPVHHKAIDLLNLSEKDSLLDLGCGSGELLSLASKHTTKLFGIDFDEIALLTGKEKVPGAILSTGNILNLPIKNNSISRVSALGVLGYLSKKDLIQAINEIDRVLKEDGLLIFRISTPINKIGTFILRLVRPGYPSHTFFYSLKTYLNLTKNNFATIKVERCLDRTKSPNPFRELIINLCSPFLKQTWVVLKKQSHSYE